MAHSYGKTIKTKRQIKATAMD